jgi:hypothetical protein
MIRKDQVGAGKKIHKQESGHLKSDRHIFRHHHLLLLEIVSLAVVVVMLQEL